MNYSELRFAKGSDMEFVTTLRKRVKQYFSDNGISKYGNGAMVRKTIFMLALFFVPYALLLSNVFESLWVMLGLWVIMGFGKAGIGLSIMHDANHGAYSQKPKVNRYMSFVMNVVGGSQVNWRIQHNVLHHTFTNIEGVDDDINPGWIMRFSPHRKRYKLHRLQHFYAWFLYSFMTLSWSTSGDFLLIRKYKKMGLLDKEKKSYTRLVTEIVLSKLMYYSYLLILPMLIINVPWYTTLGFYIIMDLIAGFTLACVFQPAHVMPTAAYPLPDEKGSLENNWAVHQLLTTTNFSPKSKILSWYVGGLNYQIEHHLFPNICHVHYKNLSDIVKKTAADFGLPYHSQPTFVKALWNHGKMLKMLGKYDTMPAA